MTVTIRIELELELELETRRCLLSRYSRQHTLFRGRIPALLFLHYKGEPPWLPTSHLPALARRLIDFFVRTAIGFDQWPLMPKGTAASGSY